MANTSGQGRFDEEELEEYDVDAEVAASDLLAMWTTACSSLSFISTKSDSTRSSSREDFHVSVDEEAGDRSPLSVTYGCGDITKDTCIFALNGKLNYVAVTVEDMVNTRSSNKLTKNDQYKVTIDLSRSASDTLDRRLNQIYSKAISDAHDTLATRAGLHAVTCENFLTSWRVDLRLFIRNSVARPQNNFSEKRAFSVLKSSQLKKPGNFVFGPAPLFFDETGRYIPPQNVRAEAVRKDVKVMFTINLSPSTMGNIFCNFDILSVQILNSVVHDSPSKKRRLELGI